MLQSYIHAATAAVCIDTHCSHACGHGDDARMSNIDHLLHTWPAPHEIVACSLWADQRQLRGREEVGRCAAQLEGLQQRQQQAQEQLTAEAGNLSSKEAHAQQLETMRQVSHRLPPLRRGLQDGFAA